MLYNERKERRHLYGLISPVYLILMGSGDGAQVLGFYHGVANAFTY